MPRDIGILPMIWVHGFRKSDIGKSSNFIRIHKSWKCGSICHDRFMTSALKHDLARLDALAFHRREYCEEDIRRYHSLRRAKHHQLALLKPLYEWQFVPVSLWPFNTQNVFAAGLTTLEGGQELDEEFRDLVALLPPLPKEDFCATVASHEHLVSSGKYEGFVTTAEKFTSVQGGVEKDPEFQNAWKAFKTRWKPARYADKKGIIRRSLSQERNFRPQFQVDWSKTEDRFRAAFDAFCLRWSLYGMEGDVPLVNKLAVNFTPYGTMVFIPAYWSSDAKRDLRWPEIMKVHRLRSLKKQGKALAEGIEWRREAAKKLRQLDAEAKKRKIKGSALHAFLCQGLGFVEATDPKRLERLRKEFSA